MRKLSILVVALMALTQVACAAPKQTPVSTFVNGCEQELKEHCSDVVPGEARLLACLYSHSDKVSGQCEYAIYDAAMQLERILADISYVANECRDDLLEYCSEVEVGDGRVVECMKKNKSKLNERCTQAIENVTE
jgi:hypothetical protein